MAKGGTWHYLPVYTGDDDDRTYSLCEVYLDGSLKLHSWTETVAIAPVGNEIDDLIGSLNKMMKDVMRWKPERYEDLHVGQKLERLDSKTNEVPHK